MEIKTTIRKNGSKRIQTFNNEPSKTTQEFDKDCDINHIMLKYAKTKQLTHLNNTPGIFDDVSEVPDLFRAQMIVQESSALFNELPATAREKFDNNPIKMMEWLKNPQNNEEAVKLGLMVKKVPQATNDDLNDEQPKEQNQPKKAKTATPPKTDGPE